MAKRAKPQRLPGVDGAIPELDNAAHDYAALRDERMALTEQEVTLKATVLKLMHKHGKTVYQHGAVTITLVPEDKTVKVKVRRATGDDTDSREAQESVA